MDRWPGLLALGLKWVRHVLGPITGTIDPCGLHSNPSARQHLHLDLDVREWTGELTTVGTCYGVSHITLLKVLVSLLV